jgi:hypothetical protein
MNRRFIKTIGLLALCLAWGARPGVVPAAPAKGVPQMVLGETVHDFGKTFENQPLTHTFVIQNKGESSLKIEDVDPDCACTVARYDKAIPPGGQGEITLTIKPYSVIHQFRKKTVVRTNDPEQPEVLLVLRGVAQPLIEIQPSHVIRFRGDPREQKQGQVRFISHLPTPWEIKGFRTNIPDKIEVGVRTEESGRVYVLEVRNRVREGGRYVGLIELFTTSKERPRMIVRVFADLYPSSAVNP